MILTAFFLARSGAVPPNGSPNLKSDPWEAALWAAVGLAVAPRLMMFGRRIFIDIYISMFMARNAALLRPRRAVPGAPPVVPAADVRVGRSWRAHEGTGGGGTSGAGVRHLPRRPRRAQTSARDDDPDRHRRRPRHRRAVVRGALPPLRMDVHHLVLPRRERRALHRGRRGGDAARPAVLPAGRVQRFVSVVALPVRCRRHVVHRAAAHSGACPRRDPGGCRREARPLPHVAVGSRNRRVLFVFSGQAGSLHLSDRAGGRRARGAADRALAARRLA